MPVPKYRTSKSKKNMRRSHHALSPIDGGFCPNCNAVKLPHRICPSCGTYKGKVVITKTTNDISTADFDAKG